VKISKTEYAVFVYYKLESKYKKSSKFEEVMVQNQKKMSDGMRQKIQGKLNVARIIIIIHEYNNHCHSD
jgi:hypothetical protein